MLARWRAGEGRKYGTRLALLNYGRRVEKLQLDTIERHERTPAWWLTVMHRFIHKSPGFVA